ncbi:MAG TPA: NADH-quinone oxidoreductase subunit M [Geobacterales bacterium]|nr:NADH-quinone oxidoreductase subunit M [Geobacterales bacterium]
MLNSLPILTLLLLLPLVGALLLLPFWRHEAVCRWIALATALAESAVAWWIFARASELPTTRLPGYFLLEEQPWLPSLGISYQLAMDGISLLLVLLTTLITLAAIVVSWRQIQRRQPLHLFFILTMASAITGVFLAQDLILFYLFWEVMLLPMLFLIGLWGHGRHRYSAIKFFLITLAGSLLMLLAIIGIHLVHLQSSGVATFSLPLLIGTPIPRSLALWLFAGFFIAFAIKVPLFPLHTWLPDAHTDAPTAGSVILAGLLLKTGAYGLIRIAYPLFPQAAQSLAPLVYLLALVGIIYGSWIAFAQEDMKRLIAYSSIGHMGFVALGIAAWTPVSISGSVIQMANHGVTTGALFVLVGMLDERGHSRRIADYGGVWQRAPILSALFLLFAMSSVGLPGLNSFVGEFLVLVGSFRAMPLAVVIAGIGLVLPLIYMTRLVKEILFCTGTQTNILPDANPREMLLLSLLVMANLYVGLHPRPFLDLIHLPMALLTTTGVQP